MLNLKIGDNGVEVEQLQTILKNQGWYLDGLVDGDFGPITEKALLKFQFSHIGPNGVYLITSGVVDENTLWALQNPSGDAQKSFIEATIPKNLPPFRTRQLEVPLLYWQSNVHEIPDGANSGDGVDRFIEGYGPVPWCMLFVARCDLEANGQYALGRREASTFRCYQRSKELGIFKPKEKYSPIPGDWALFQYRNSDGSFKGTGHISFVMRVSQNRDLIQTIGGNESNRVKVGTRPISTSSLIGFVNIFNDFSYDFEYGLAPKFQAGGVTSERNTR